MTENNHLNKVKLVILLCLKLIELIIHKHKEKSMKKHLLFIVSLLLVSSFMFAQNIKVGGSAGFATDIASFGISANGTYTINKEWEAAASFTHYFENDFVTWNALDFDAHYYFTKKGGFDIYAIGGLNILMWEIEINWGLGTTSTSNTDIGLNLGTGATKKLNKNLDLFAEAKYSISNGSYLSVRAGVLFRL